MRAGWFVGASVLCLAFSRPALAAPWDKPGYTVTFHDEFDGPTVDTTQWVKRYKWGETVINAELQAYVDDAFQFQNSVLRIVASHQPGTYDGKTMAYRSGVIASVHEQTFGYFEARCRMPPGTGLWPAFWLLGANGTPGVNEIDIHEFLGNDLHTIHTTVHWGASYNPPDHKSDGKAFTGPDFTADYHTFAVDWDTNHVIWYVDGAEVFRHEGVGVPQVKMYIIANLAVGGSWPGSPDANTVFPAYYDIDYIRAYQVDPDAGVPTDAATPDDAGDSGTVVPPESGVGGTAGVGGSSGGTGGTAGVGGSSGGAGTGGRAPNQGQGPTSEDASSGCNCSLDPSPRSVASFGWLLLAAVGIRRRRRLSRCRAP